MDHLSGARGRHRMAGMALENQHTINSGTVVDGMNSSGSFKPAASSPRVGSPGTGHVAAPPEETDVLPPAYVQALLSLNVNVVGIIRQCLKRGDLHSQFQGARALREAARDYPACRAAIGAAGAARALLRLLRETEPSLLLEALQALVNLTCECPENRALIPSASMDALQLIIEQLDSQYDEIQEKSAELVFSLSLDNSNKVELNHSGATPYLIRLLGGSPDTQRVACKALYNISLAASCRFAVIEEGAIPPLMQLAKANKTDEQKRVGEKALLVLKVLCSVKSGWEEIGSCPEWPQVFLSGAETSSVVGQEASVSVLLELASRSRERKTTLMLQDPLPLIWKLAQSKERRLRAKANELQRLLEA